MQYAIPVFTLQWDQLGGIYGEGLILPYNELFSIMLFFKTSFTGGWYIQSNRVSNCSDNSNDVGLIEISHEVVYLTNCKLFICFRRMNILTDLIHPGYCGTIRYHLLMHPRSFKGRGLG